MLIYPSSIFAHFGVDSIETLAATAQAPTHHPRQIDLSTIVSDYVIMSSGMWHHVRRPGKNFQHSMTQIQREHGSAILWDKTLVSISD